ncbi:MAG: tyrosine-type recombinase/integrase [Bryobacteraceae bacterium]
MPRERYQQPKLRQTRRGVWFIRPWVDVVKDAGIARTKKTVTLGIMGKREAQAKAREVMQTVNRAEYVIMSQINMGRFLDEYQTMHVDRLAASTRDKYTNHLKNHIRPAFEKLMLCEFRPLLVQRWLDAKGEDADGKAGLSWATRTDLRNILSSVFTKAIEWGRWKDRNPIERVHVGRKQAVREQRKLTDDETRRLLGALPADVRLVVCVGLFCTLRISEILGLQEKHLDFERGLIQVRQRFYRGNLDEPKNQKARRDVPMGYLVGDLKALCAGDPERFVFQIRTRPEWGKKAAVCRDDRDIQQHFLRPAAKALGIYWPGFGFHTFRREAVTAFSQSLGVAQAMRMAGHSTMDMSLAYTLADQATQDGAVRSRQEALIGKTGEKIQ